MDEFEMTLALQFTPQTVFSMLGALVGSLISADVKRYGWRLTILFTIVASVVGVFQKQGAALAPSYRKKSRSLRARREQWSHQPKLPF